MSHFFTSEVQVVKRDYILTLALNTIFLQGQFFTLPNRRTFVVAGRGVMRKKHPPTATCIELQKKTFLQKMSPRLVKLKCRSLLRIFAPEAHNRTFSKKSIFLRQN